MIELTKRQQQLYKTIVESAEPIGTSEIETALSRNYDMSRDTLLRELKFLMDNDLIQLVGSGPSTAYCLKSTLLTPIDPDSYFSHKQDDRQLTDEPNSEFFDKLSSTDLLPNLSSLSKKITDYRKRVADLPIAYHQKELERFTIDFAWKSSEIEGNTYSQVETETLLKLRQKAAGHSEAEAVMIINHKSTFDFVRQNLENFKKLNISDIIDVHKSLTQGLGVDFDIRKRAVRIGGTNYIPATNTFTLRESLVRATEIVNKKTNPIEKALLASALIIYLQPFVDGNKRTSRMIANAVLMAYNIAPISYRNTDNDLYKKAVLLLDEQHNINLYRQMFLGSLEFSVDNYEL
jgi:fido (protein-threonine AMPylation protein)